MVSASLSVLPEAGLFFCHLPAMLRLPRSRNRRGVKTMDNLKAVLEEMLVAQVLTLAASIRQGKTTSSDCVREAVYEIRRKKPAVLQALLDIREGD